jgi:predicted HicB family RNase H-like nuclease
MEREEIIPKPKYVRYKSSNTLVNTKQLRVEVRPEVRQSIHDDAQAMGISINQLMRRIIDMYLYGQF